MIQTEEFSGPGAIFALILASVREDYNTLDHSTSAYQTARKFLEGGECEHVLCADCGSALEGWESQECKPIYPVNEFTCYTCAHPLHSHYVATFDWSEHRGIIIESLGMNESAIVSLILQKHKVGS